MSRRFDRGIVLTLVTAAMLSVAVPAAAYNPSPQYGAFELKFGPYKPAVDDNPSLSAPVYHDMFDDDTMFLTSLELDWQFIHPPGFSLGLGASIGFMQTYAKSWIDDAGGDTTGTDSTDSTATDSTDSTATDDTAADSTDGEQSSVDYTVLNVMPFSVLFVLRVDALPEYLNVPIAPYFKIGINWYLWWILGSGDVASYNDEKGRGGTLGWQFAPGLAFQLDPLDRATARTFDNEVGVNHSYLFVEVLWAHVNRFGNSDYMNLSTDTFANATVLAGLALEF